MKFIPYLTATVAGLLFSSVGLVLAMTGGPGMTYLIGGLLLLAHAGAIVFVVRKARAGNGSRYAFVLALPMFIVAGGLWLFVLGRYGFSLGASLALPDSEEFVAECRSAGAEYLRLPATPVRSIAYDWNTSKAPSFNQFEVRFGTRITSLRHSFPHPKSIEFIERKRSDLEGRPSQGSDSPYVRFPQTGAYYGIQGITADILVRYHMSPEGELSKPKKEQGMVRYEMAVVDRRTNETLATLRYVIDAQKQRGCGLTGKGELSGPSFVLNAIGLE